MKDLDKNNSPEIYQQFLSEIVNMVHTHRVHAVQSVQRISNQLYWNIGELIIQRQKEYGWGKSIVERLSKDLPHHLGDAVSWSPRNLWFMRQLVSEYSILKQVDSHLANSSENISNLKQAVSELDLSSKTVSNALRIANKPIGVANYTLSKNLPNEFLGKLPTADEFKQILNDKNHD